MSKPVRLLKNPEQAPGILTRFAGRPGTPLGASYATVRDYCESRDELPQITPFDGDLKNVQRPWAAKTIMAHVPPPARLVEIGGGEPIVCGFLAELGYDVTLIDPYDGFANGPTDYQRYVEQFPNVKIIRDYLRPGLPGLAPRSFDAVFSISVLEHVPPDQLTLCFQAIAEFLKPAGASIHCFDFIVHGNGDAFDRGHAEKILAHQAMLSETPVNPPVPELLNQVRTDVETFFLSPQGHHNWRGGRPYDEFPFRKVVSIQTVARRAN